jgi:hypothetical protein
LEETDKDVFPTKVLKEDESTDKALLTSPIAEMEVVLLSLCV